MTSPLTPENYSQNYSQEIATKQIFWFSACFAGHMDMYSDLETVANYLDNHQGWFSRCAQPMQVELLNQNAYILNVGKFASLGYEVEPKVAIALDPPQDNLYVMRTVPIPNHQFPGYEVQYKSFMELEPLATTHLKPIIKRKIISQHHVLPQSVTRVSWELDIGVTVEFPRFMRKLPTNLIQVSGDRFLAQIVRQISPRLSYKVQQDFHLERNLPVPDKSSRKFKKLLKESIFAEARAQPYPSQSSV